MRTRDGLVIFSSHALFENPLSGSNCTAYPKWERCAQNIADFGWHQITFRLFDVKILWRLVRILITTTNDSFNPFYRVSMYNNSLVVVLPTVFIIGLGTPLLQLGHQMLWKLQQNDLLFAICCWCNTSLNRMPHFTFCKASTAFSFFVPLHFFRRKNYCEKPGSWALFDFFLPCTLSTQCFLRPVELFHAFTIACSKWISSYFLNGTVCLFVWGCEVACRWEKLCLDVNTSFYWFVKTP